MGNDLISVIVPIYNCEAYIKKCITSLINQSYENLEIILVDDASTDNSLQICRQLEDNRIKLIEKKKNSGVSDTRNIGIEVSNGNYVAFVDADDYLEERTIEELYAKILQYGYPDMIVFGLISEYYSKGKLIRTKESCRKSRYLTKSELKDDFFDLSLGNSVCNKLFRKEILNNVRFDTSLYIAEDLEFCLDAYLYAESIYIDRRSFYHYCIDVDKEKTYRGEIIDFSKASIRISERRNKYLMLGIARDRVQEDYCNKLINCGFESCLLTVKSNYLSDKDKVKHLKNIVDSTELVKALRHNYKNNKWSFHIKKYLLKIKNEKVLLCIFTLLSIIHKAGMAYYVI